MKTGDLIADLSRDLRPVRPLPSPLARFGYWTVLSSVWMGVATLAVGIRSDLPDALWVPRVMVDLLLSLSVALLAAWSAFSLAVPGERGWVRSARVGCLALLVWTGHTVWRAWGGYRYEALMYSLSSGYDCFVTVFVLGLLPGVLLFGMLRRAAPTEFLWSGGMALLATGALGSLGAQLHCGGAAAFHILVHHFCPVLVAGFAGLLVGRWLLERRAAG